jgi:hypothetical protein
VVVEVVVAAAVAVVVVADVEILTMIEDTIEAMTDTKIMITGTGNVLTWDFCSELGDGCIIWHLTYE